MTMQQQSFHWCAELLTLSVLLGSVSVSAEGGAGDPSGPRGAQRYPVPAEVHPGGERSLVHTLPVMGRHLPARSVLETEDFKIFKIIKSGSFCNYM